MNTDTGRLYQLGADLQDARRRGDLDGALAHLRDLEAHHPDEGDTRTNLAAAAALGRALTADEQAAIYEEAKGATIVAVSDQVAQKVRLGERELERRKRRRDAAKQARARNR